MFTLGPPAQGRSNHDLNAVLAPGRAEERRLGIRAIGTPQVAMGDQPNRPDNAQDQHDHEIPVTRVPQYVPPEHLDLVHNRYFRPASRHRVWLCLCGIHARSAGDEHCCRRFPRRPRPWHVRCNLGCRDPQNRWSTALIFWRYTEKGWPMARPRRRFSTRLAALV